MADELRQGINNIGLVGVIKEHKLNAGKGDNGKYINGYFVLKAGEFTEVTVKTMVNETNSNGKVKKSYETLNKILKGEAQTMVEVPEEEATKVRIWGKGDFTPKFKEEMYKPENEPEVKTSISVDLGFGNINIDNSVKPEDYRATFDLEMFVEKVEEEIVNDEETGRVLVSGWTPVYGGTVIPLTVVAGIIEDEEGEYDFAEDIRSQVDEEATVNFWGDIDFRKIVEVVKKGGSMGRAKTEENTTYIHDLVATGADFIEDENAYEIEDIQKALAERENKKQEAANKDSAKDKGKGKGVKPREGRTARIDKSKTASGSTSEAAPKKERRF